ncbi:MAG TPA: BBP7 family outer membrane beta-barrel protein, partial [Urbifossiella sp.]
PATGPPGPRGPNGEYDPGYFYLPERAPENTGPNACGPAGRFWIAPNLELAWMKPFNTPNLVRVGTPNGPVAYGGPQATLFTPGFSLNGGFWLNQERTRGFDASFFYLPQTGVNTVFFSNGSALLLPTANGGTFPLADANYAGSYQAGWTTHFTSADVNYRNCILCTPDGRIDALVGYRFANVGDTASLYGKRLGPDGQIVRFRDDIDVSNNFHGGQIGLAGEYRMNRWFISGSSKVAFGAMFTDSDLEGKFRVNGVVVPLGFYSRPGVDGTREHTNFAVMPVVGVTLGRQITDHSRVYLGYNFLYVNSLTRAPDVIDPTPTVLTSNPQAPLAAASAIRRDSTTSDFWVQSLNLGMEWRF